MYGITLQNYFRSKVSYRFGIRCYLAVPAIIKYQLNVIYQNATETSARLHAVYNSFSTRLRKNVAGFNIVSCTDQFSFVQIMHAREHDRIIRYERLQRT